jgi:HAD superfamily hydrolase (TIGR01549 family)
MNPIRAALFDVDGTLYRQAPVRACMAAEMALWFGASGRPLALRRHAAVLLAFRAVREELRRLGRPAAPLADLQFEETARRTGCPAHEVREMVDGWMIRRPQKYLRLARREDVAALIGVLQRSGVRLGVLSDYPCAGKIEALGLSGAFELQLCTTDPGVNAFKPHPRGLLRACEHWRLPPADVVYVGDRADVDQAAANAAGMRCYLVNASGPASATAAASQRDEAYGTRGLEELRRDCRAVA